MRTEIFADGIAGARARAVARARKLDRGERLMPVREITFDSPLDLAKILTPERVRLIEALRKHPAPLQQIALKLKRDPRAVRRDVNALESWGVLRSKLQTNPGHGRIRIIEASVERVRLVAEV